MLRLVEEIILLLLRDDGRFVRTPNWSMDYAVAGAVLMDLAMEDRIDTDLDNLILLDTTPLGDDLLDPTLAEIAEAQGDPKDTRYWIEHTAEQAAVIRENAISRLVDIGILEREDDHFLWVFRSRRYPIIDGKSEREVKLRIMGVLFSDEIPYPRDVMLICLADACDIFRQILTGRELTQAADRIEVVRRLDLIGQAMSKAITDIEIMVASSVQRYIH